MDKLGNSYGTFDSGVPNDFSPYEIKLNKLDVEIKKMAKGLLNRPKREALEKVKADILAKIEKNRAALGKHEDRTLDFDALRPSDLAKLNGKIRLKISGGKILEGDFSVGRLMKGKLIYPVENIKNNYADDQSAFTLQRVVIFLPDRKGFTLDKEGTITGSGQKVVKITLMDDATINKLERVTYSGEFKSGVLDEKGSILTEHIDLFRNKGNSATLYQGDTEESIFFDDGFASGICDVYKNVNGKQYKAVQIKVFNEGAYGLPKEGVQWVEDSRNLNRALTQFKDYLSTSD